MVSPVCHSDNSSVKMVSVVCWWTDTEGKVKYLDKTCPKATLSTSHGLTQDLN